MKQIIRQMSITNRTPATKKMIHIGIAVSSTIGGTVVGGSVVVVCLLEEDMVTRRDLFLQSGSHFEF